MNSLKIYFSIVFATFTFTVMAQDLNTGIWKIKSNAILAGADTLYLFQMDQQENSFDLEQISYDFNLDGSYDGTSVDGTAFQGTWNVTSAEITFDGHVAEYQPIDETEFLLIADFGYVDSTGMIFETKSILHFFDSETSATSNLVSFEDLMNVYPIPFTEHLNFELLTTLRGKYDLEITDALGRNMLSDPVMIDGSAREISISSHSFPPGTYLATLRGKGQRAYKKLVKIANH